MKHCAGYLALLFVGCVALAVAKPSSRQMRGDEEIFMNTDQIIANRGYPVETHTIQTADGYLLDCFRIPYGRRSGPKPNKPVVFLQHGLLSSSADWIIGHTESALGYMLADAGYDVWLGAVRGNTYGRKHITLDPDVDAKAFWDFSFDQHGAVDVSSQLNYILELTKQPTLAYVGHSQGTLTFFIAMETNPDLNSKINQMYALAPVTTVANARSPIRLLAPYADDIETLASLIGVYEFLPSQEFYDLIGQEDCSLNSTLLPVCDAILFLICGPDITELDQSLISLIVSHSPAGSSVRNVVHYAQEINNANYAYYDYGGAGNLANYGQATPRLYDPSKVRAPVMTFWGDNDWLADPKDVAWLEPQLPNLTRSVHIPIFNHLDFLWALDVKPLVNDIILESLPIKPTS